MDLLKWLLVLPWRVARGLAGLLGWTLRPLVGDIAWAAPRWMHLVRRHPGKCAGALAAAIVLASAGWWSWNWYQHRPRPQQTTFQVKAPAVTDYTQETPVVRPLVVVFSGSAAPIEQAGKPVKQGVSTSPQMKGEWAWTDGRTLTFTPEGDWPVGQHYQVRFDVQKVFAPQVHMAKDRFEFDTVPFVAQLGTGEFYQDPQQASVKQVIQKLAFNYPVDAAQLEQRIHLAIADRENKPGAPLKFSVTYDKQKLNAWVHSLPLALPHDRGQLLVKVDKGASSARGGSGTPKELQGRIGIPGLYSLALQDLKPTLVDDDKNEPQQVLVMSFNGAVRTEDVSSRIQAWVLPKRKPGTTASDEAKPYHWSVQEVSEAVLKSSQPLALAPTPTEQDAEPMQSFRFRAEPGQGIFVRLDKGLESFGGYQLGQPSTTIVTVPPYPQLLRFVGAGSLLSMSGSQRISVVSRNLPGVKVVVHRLLPEQLQHMVSLNQGDYSHPRLLDGFDKNQITERYLTTQAVPDHNPAKASYTGIDLGKYLADGKRGVFLIRVAAHDPALAKRASSEAAQACAHAQKLLAPVAGAAVTSGIPECEPVTDQAGDMEGSPADSRLIVVTDLGMLVKKAGDGSQDVFVQSIRSGKPVAGAAVAVVALNGKTLLSQTTGVDGKVSFPSLTGFEHDRRPVMYLVTQGKDMSFLPIGTSDRALDYSRFDVGGDANAPNPGQLSGHLFSDRGLYRPGEMLHVGLIVRAADWARSVAGIPLEANIVDPRGTVVKQFPLSLDASGFGEVTYTTVDTAATGTWTVNLYIVRDGKADTQIGSTTVTVKEFLPDRLKVRAGLSQTTAEGWVKPKDLQGEVNAENLFGTPAANRRVSASLTLRPAYPAFKSWSGWNFYDIRRAKEGYQQELQDAQTDDNGHAALPLDLSQYADATYQLYFLAKVYDAEGGRAVAAATQAMVSNDDWLVGYQSTDALDYVSRNALRKVRLVAIDPSAKSIALPGLTAQLVERKYVSVLTKQDSGVFKYQSRVKEVAVHQNPLTIAAGGMDVTLPTDKPGDYVLRIVRTDDGKEVNRIAYSVAGAANLSRSLERNAELQLTLNKATFQPGETIQVAVRAPYVGSGLITLERDKVYAHAWFHTDTTSSVQTITVPAGFEGNGYVNVQFVRDPSSDAIFMSPLSYGVAPFRMSDAPHREALRVQAPALVKPGSTATFKVRTNGPAKVVLFAVNEGILQVARYKLDDPLEHFFRKRMLGVSTSQILDLILPDFEKLMSLAAAPGGDGDAAIGRQLNPFARKKKAPVAYWSGIVQVNGEQEFSYPVPDDFNGTLRVMAVAVSPDRIGTWQGATTVRGDFVLTPNAPTTLAPGDEAEVSVGVANNLTDIGTQTAPVAVTLTTGPGLQVVGPATQSIPLASLREGVLQFRVKATDALGSVALDFSASYGKHLAKLSTDLSVRPDVAYRTSVVTTRVAPDSQTDVGDLRTLYAPYARRNAVLSSSPVVLARGLTSYLINYPDQGTEQIISAAMPRLIVDKWPAAPAFVQALQPVFAREPVSNGQALASALSTLQTRQNDAGGFGLWSATPTAQPFVSAYAMNFMLEARQRGVMVPQSAIAAGNQYLKELAADDSQTSLSDLRTRAYAIYLLTVQGNVTTNQIAAVQARLDAQFPKQWKSDLAAAWLAASYKLLQQDGEANKLIAGPLKVLQRAKPSSEGFDFVDYYDPGVRDASVLYIVSKHFADRAKALPPQVFENIAWPLEQGSYNTLSSAMTLLALDSYAGMDPGNLGQLAIDSMTAKGVAHAIGVPQGRLLQATDWGADAAKLRFANRSKQHAWSVVTQSGYDRSAPTKAIKQGLEIVRDYTASDGKPLGTITVGQEIEVHVKVRAIGNEAVGSVAVVDLLPGGFDPVLRPPPPASAGGAAQGDGEASEPDDAAQSWTSPLGLDSSSWQADFADVREDRVVIYGSVSTDVREFVYKIRATNVGSFQIPPAYASAIYRPSVQAQAPAGGKLTVARPK